ncbi:uncharacterized protein LOC128870017 [Anastrepha ludens]|uniref:uncharacterized protein LOC128870017 n=1 Tax=Anastrepha ludens TaxID=28586 RepID=UPI0023B1FE53|nr:uncharacterized protein LOC128870017 [Anastrepha ludens]
MPLNRTPPHSSDANHSSTKQPTDGASRQGDINPYATNKVMIVTNENQKQRSSSMSSINPNETNITNSTSNDKNWTLVKNPKRPLVSPQNISKAKQQKVSYWLSNENKFDALSMDDNNELKADKIPEKEKPLKPPPIFVDRVENIHPLLDTLNEFDSYNYELRVIGSNRVKIQPKTPEAFTNLVKLLERKKTEFYTYKPKNERSFKVILRNMHPSVEPEEIKLALKEYGHSVTNVWNMKHSQNKRALPMFVVEMVQNPNNKSIYDIRNLLHSRITFEPPGQNATCHSVRDAKTMAIQNLVVEDRPNALSAQAII